jgi:hypothetical protein
LGPLFLSGCGVDAKSGNDHDARQLAQPIPVHREQSRGRTSAVGSGFKNIRLSVPNTLFKMPERTVPPLGGFKRPKQPDIPFNTTEVIFICGGAFVGLEDITAKRLGRGGFGFDRLSKIARCLLMSCFGG